jgi:YidC/Oxa1 family membrane protein insertase
MLWSGLIDMLRGGLFVLAHWCGGSVGAAIMLGSLAARAAMLPLTIPAQRRALRMTRRQRALAPELAALKKTYGRDPAALMRETQRLYAARGVTAFDPRMLLDTMLQFPPAAAIYSVVRSVQRQAGSFLWVADLARPDRLLAIGAAVIAAALAWLGVKTSAGANTAQGMAPIVVTGLVSFLILSHMSSAVALYSVVNSVVGGVERAIAARTLPPDDA